MKKIIVIPARLQSTRLPNKLLLDLAGKSIIQRVYEQCLKAKKIESVHIAVDDEKLVEHCLTFTKNIIVTSKEHQSGTDRIAEAIAHIDCDAVINVQGDEPFISPTLIDEISESLEKNQMVSAMCVFKTLADVKDPNNVKVIVNKKMNAIYFSRSVIPFCREGMDLEKQIHYKHLGIYGYSKDFLHQYAKMETTNLEQIEKLEQLRVLENGYQIKMIPTAHNAIGIDTLEDYEKAIENIKSQKTNAINF